MSKLVSKNKAISMSRSAGAMANGILNGRIWVIFQLSLGDISYRVCQWIYKLWWVQGKLQKYINDRSGDPPCHNDVPRNFMEEFWYTWNALNQMIRFVESGILSADQHPLAMAMRSSMRPWRHDYLITLLSLDIWSRLVASDFSL